MQSIIEKTVKTWASSLNLSKILLHVKGQTIRKILTKNRTRKQYLKIKAPILKLQNTTTITLSSINLKLFCSQ